MFTLLFGDYTFPNQTFEIKGLDAANDIKEDKIPRRHGAIFETPYLGSRKIKIHGFIHNSTVEASHTELMAMQAGLLASEKAFQYRSDRYINCRTKSIKADQVEGTDKAVFEVDIELAAGNPFFLSTGASYSDEQNAIKGPTLLFDIGNGGNVFSEPDFSFCATGGTISDDLILTNLTNNKSLKFRGVIANGVTLIVDSEDFTVLDNGVDGLSNFEGDFITLDVGTNSFQFVGATCRITTEHKYRWY